MKYNVQIVYSKRKTLSITVSADNKVTLRCTLGYNSESAERFLREKSGWIERAIQKNENKLSKNADVISYEKIYVYGQKVPLFIGYGKNGIYADCVYVKNIKSLKKLFMDYYEEELYKGVENIAVSTGLKYNGITVKNYKSRWGCCDGKNNISFNYKIFMLPPHLQRYIIVHELCHTVQHNHSEKFWRLVERFLPQYKQLKKELRGYDFLTTLY